MPAAEGADAEPSAPRAAGRPPRVRLFVALELPAATRAALAAWRDEALAGDPAWRPIAREALHVTLCFLGWRAPQDAAPVGRVLARCAAGVPAVDLGVGTVALLPPRRPRVLAVDLLDRNGVLGAFQASLAGELSAQGLFEPERRPFRPHVTLARVRARARPARRDLRGPSAPAFRAPAATLYRSHPERGGARYESLARAVLAGG